MAGSTVILGDWTHAAESTRILLQEASKMLWRLTWGTKAQLGRRRGSNLGKMRSLLEAAQVAKVTAASAISSLG